MEKNAANELTIREYLLGRLDANSKLIEQIDEQILSDAEFSDTVDIIEDEIIEEYLEGVLSTVDKQAVETHFLRPPERQSKLHNARLLHRHFAIFRGTSKNNAPDEVDIPLLPKALPYQTRPNFAIYAGVAMALLLVTFTLYFIKVRRDFQAELKDNNQILEQERERSSALNQQLQTVHELAQPATVMFSLFKAGRDRSVPQLPQLKTGAGTQKIHVEITVLSTTPGTYQVQLESGGKNVWLGDNINPFIAQGGSILMFDIPTDILVPGECRFVVKQGKNAELSYLFLYAKQ